MAATTATIAPPVVRRARESDGWRWWGFHAVEERREVPPRRSTRVLRASVATERSIDRSIGVFFAHLFLSSSLPLVLSFSRPLVLFSSFPLGDGEEPRIRRQTPDDVVSRRVVGNEKRVTGGGRSRAAADQRPMTSSHDGWMTGNVTPGAGGAARPPTEPLHRPSHRRSPPLRHPMMRVSAISHHDEWGVG